MAIQKIFGISPDIRYLNELREVLYDQKWLKKFSEKSLTEFAVYYMYRDIVKKENDRPKIEQSDLRYDITIIPPKMFGSEYPKTLGHLHSLAIGPPRVDSFASIRRSGPRVEAGANLTYPEIYQVLDGQACFFQLKFGAENQITEIWALEAKKNDIVIILPNYGHITINIGKKALKMANWISRQAKSDYSILKNKKGGPYFVVKNKPIKWVKNKNYSSAPEIKFAQPINSSILGLKKNEDIYNLIKNPARMDFLKNPRNHLDLFAGVVKLSRFSSRHGRD